MHVAVGAEPEPDGSGRRSAAVKESGTAEYHLAREKEISKKSQPCSASRQTLRQIGLITGAINERNRRHNIYGCMWIKSKNGMMSELSRSH